MSVVFLFLLLFITVIAIAIVAAVVVLVMWLVRRGSATSTGPTGTGSPPAAPQ